jgi:hypothetical protein
LNDEELVKHAMDRGVWDGVKLMRGMNLEQTRRYWILNEKFEIRLAEYMAPYRAAADAAGTPRPMVRVDEKDIYAALGAHDALEYRSVINQANLAVAELETAVFDQYGPVQRHLSAAEVQANLLAGPANPQQQFGPNALWKFVQRYPDGSIDQVLSAPGPGDDRSPPLSVAENPGPFEPQIQPMTQRLTMISVNGQNFGEIPLTQGATAAATITVDGQNFAVPSLFLTPTTTTATVGGVSYPITRAQPAAAP